MLGYLPLPEVEDCQHIIDILFKVGPVKREEPISELDLEGWERRRGVQLSPWYADTLIEMSRAYLSEQYSASKVSAPPPWPRAVKMWKYVTDKIHAPQEKAKNGRSQ